MTTEEALSDLKATLGKDLYPTAIPKVKEILKSLEKDSSESRFEQAQETVTEWYEPRPLPC